MPYNKNSQQTEEPDVYTDEKALDDLTSLVAAATSGMKGAISDFGDEALAELILELINTRYDSDGMYCSILTAELSALNTKNVLTYVEKNRMYKLKRFMKEFN